MTMCYGPELLAPAGTWDCAKAAVENGADAIYFGLDRFNARMRSQNFTEADLPELMAFLHSRGVKGYVTFNTLIFPGELAAAERYLRTMISAGVDAAIVQDVGMCRLIRHLSPDFPIHGSTQMTVTSAAGVEFANNLGVQLVVLARECSLKDIEKIQQQTKDIALPLEVFVHGALCVAYSGQCLTSESLGGRSANRGECAQACRMTYDMKVDGELVDLGDKQYLLSPQDLSGLPVLPDLIKSGVSCLKIEGRLKAPEYVANVTRVYRQALDRALQTVSPAIATEKVSLKLGNRPISYQPTADERYNLEMAFSRGLYTGWFRGINNQKLVHARFAKKRGVYLGDVVRVTRQQVELRPKVPVKAGDGIVFDSGHPDTDQGGRIYGVEDRGRTVCLSFSKHGIDLRQVKPGYKVWKTSDPELDKVLRQSYSGEQPQVQQPIDIEVHGVEGEPVVAIATDPQGHIARATSAKRLELARNQPLTSEKLVQQLSRLGNTPFQLGALTNYLAAGLMVPVSELNRLRRDLVEQLLEQRMQPQAWKLEVTHTYGDLLPGGLGCGRAEQLVEASGVGVSEQSAGLLGFGDSIQPTLLPLVRNFAQLRAVLAADITTVYCELENPVRYRDAVALSRELNPKAQIYVAPPRITKPGEQYILKQVHQSDADGYLVRNYDHLKFFAHQPCIGDFSLNVANPITADYFKTRFGLERLTASYDLNISQLLDLLTATPADWFDITVHQHMPMFHMEHCVFCAFLSDGTDFSNCGRPCEKHEVVLCDRTGTEHVLQADAGCRNTLYNGVAQTGAEFIPRLIEQGARHFRIDFLNETPNQVQQILSCYQQLLRGDITGRQLWQTLQLSNQLGVTRGTLENRRSA
ncbi:U32 family peptidase [Leptolyngbyaceae cyanobacterium CCMR0082]|uniref:U32 family peptidase n=1 Tax=Adonisia turfae CCMR0082 TaxID=2304604 RepID=A0A6M0SCN4_9CYAN|nr:U32 family peptidase [Adonisia turfae]NEZ65741.1 U32 family peptidase [Adonisia turfae CCMR0082]